MKYPITEFFSDKEVIDKVAYLGEKEVFAECIKTLKKYKIDTALFVFTKEFPEKIKNKLQLLYFSETASCDYPVYIYNKKFLIVNEPIGAPIATVFMEELGFLGIVNFFACGSAGCVGHTVDTSKFFLVERAIRDEGTSYKYLKPSVYAYTDKELTNCLKQFLINNNFKYTTVTTWTTDAFFRETPKAIEKRIKQGATCVEMECASWCAVANFRGYKFAQLLYTSDITKQGEWSGFIDNTERKAVKQIGRAHV